MPLFCEASNFYSPYNFGLSPTPSPKANVPTITSPQQANARTSQKASPEILALLQALRQKCAIGFVGGSDLVKQEEQIGEPAGVPVTTLFDFCFSENGLTAFKLGQALPSNSFIQWIGEAQYKELVNFCLHYVADLDIPVKRGTFVEFRNGMINVSPVGRNASNKERNDFEAFDKDAKVREKFVAALREKFGHLGLTYVCPPNPPALWF
jgi:phosphomannomutase